MAEKKREIRFGEAMEELESILERIDKDEVDIDQLATELKRAAELLEICRQRIRAADVEVSAIVQQLEAAEDQPVAAAEMEDEDESGGD
jgi:exodeoxyribonuclease VII small subunit